ncbi:hypothetical protein Tco_1558036, partial [Tanacetum coccineum]
GPIFQGEGSTVPVESHHTPTSAPSTSQPPTSPPSMQTTHVAEEAATMPYDSPLLRVHLHGSDEGSMTFHELTVLCITLSKKVKSLEFDLKQTKLTYGAAYTKLIMKVKKLDNRIKLSKARRRVRIIVLEDKDDLENPSKQGRKIAKLDEDEGSNLVQMGVQTQGRHEHDLEPDFESAAKRKDKGKAIMKEAEPIQKKRKLQLEQERLGYEEALRLQEQLDEEERQRIARAQERERYYEADKARLLVELINETKRKFAQQRPEQKRNKPMTQAQQRTYMCNYIKHMVSHTLQQLKKLSFDKIKELFKTTMKRVNTFTPMESDDTVLKVVAESSKRDAEQELNQESSKRQKIGEGSEPVEESKDELSQEQLQQLIVDKI